MFALEGALIGIGAKLDLLGVAVIAFVAALGGGILRDVLLGDTPPAALRDGRYTVAVAAAVAAAALLHAPLGHGSPVLLVLDAAGLALFAVAGAGKALAAQAGPLAAVLLGGLTATGGGVVRDMLLAEIPMVLRLDIYATAALAGSLGFVVIIKAGAPRGAAAAVGGALCFALRMAGALQHWQLPVLG